MGTYAIALAAKNESELHALANDLRRAGIKHFPIIECDEPYTGQIMAIGIAPCNRKPLKPLLAKFRLVGTITNNSPVAQSGQSAKSNDLGSVAGSNPAGRAIPWLRWLRK